MLRGALIVSLILYLLSVQGCSGTVEPTDVARIEVGTLRSELERVLGDPIEIEESENGLVYTYSYAYDANESDDLPKDYGGCVGGCAMAFLLIIPITLIIDASGALDDTHMLHVIHGADGRVQHAETGEQRERRRTAESEKREAEELWSAAELGDVATAYQLPKIADNESLKNAPREGADALFHLGRSSKPGSDLQFLWYCHAAHNGHPTAQFLLAARFYGPTLESETRDFEKSYLWYSLARANGDEMAKARLSQLRSEMFPEDIHKSEILLSAWRPNPAECKGEAATISGGVSTP
jgi:TPR repeat protein